MAAQQHDHQGSLVEREVRVWDLGVRLFHWVLVLLVITAFVTIKFADKLGPNALTWHTWCGYGVLTLVGFRIVWGFIGGTHARFTDFLRGPGAVIAYMKGMLDRSGHKPIAGHNPMGGLSVVAMLAVLLFQAVSGLMVNDEDFAFEGPLYKWAGKELSDRLTSLHHLNEKVIILLVMVHLAAIIFYRIYHRDNLVTPMLTGKRVLPGGEDAGGGNPVLAAILIALCGAGVYVLINAAK